MVGIMKKSGLIWLNILYIYIKFVMNKNNIIIENNLFLRFCVVWNYLRDEFKFENDREIILIIEIYYKIFVYDLRN